jgi:hypothetical protein
LKRRRRSHTTEKYERENTGPSAYLVSIVCSHSGNDYTTAHIHKDVVQPTKKKLSDILVKYISQGRRYH